MAGASSTVEITVVAGTRVRATVTFVPLGTTTPDDPSTVTVKVQSPAGVIVSYVYGTAVELIRDSTGVYHVEFNCSSRGLWWAKFIAAGTTGINAVREVSIKSDGTVIS